MVSIDELRHKIKIKYEKKNELVHQVNELKLDIEALEIMLDTQLKKAREQLRR